MAAIGTLHPTRDGGWAGPIFILARDVKITLAPNDNQSNANAPAFRIIAGGGADLGGMWKHRTSEAQPRDYLSGEMDFPGLAEPVSFAVFFSEDGQKARAVWNRRTAQ